MAMRIYQCEVGIICSKKQGRGKECKLEMEEAGWERKGEWQSGDSRFVEDRR